MALDFNLSNYIFQISKYIFNSMSYFKIALLSLLFSISSIMLGQEWKLELENEKIKVYTKEGEEDNIKSYRAISMLNFPAEEIYKVYIDFDNYNKWFEELSDIELMDSSAMETQDIYQYYSVINFPWPFNDRDMMSELTIDNSLEGTYFLQTKPIENYVMNEDYVRLNNFYQNTELIKVTENKTKIIMEGKFDAGGSVPTWLMNMFVINSPQNSVVNIENYLVEKLSKN